MWENTTPSTELPRDFCAAIGPLQLGGVLVLLLAKLENKHNAELQRTDPGTRVRGTLSTKARIFPPNAKMDFYYFHRFS